MRFAALFSNVLATCIKFKCWHRDAETGKDILSAREKDSWLRKTSTEERMK